MFKQRTSSTLHVKPDKQMCATIKIQTMLNSVSLINVNLYQTIFLSRKVKMVHLEMNNKIE